MSKDSLGGGRSKHPGAATAWLNTSDAKDPTTNKFVRAFDKSHLFKRQRTLADLEVPAQAEYINLCSALVRSSIGP